METGAEYSVWIEAEEWPAGDWTPADDNSDVVVAFGSGERWVATFVTYRNVGTLRERNQESGECLSGGYLAVSDLILIDELTRPRVEEVVTHLLSAGEFPAFFRRVS